MALLTLQIGQCGNTLGEAFFSQLDAQAARAEAAGAPHRILGRRRRRRWFREPEDETDDGFQARAILLDTEPKVVEAVLQRGRRQAWRYAPSHAVCEAVGSGNNWAVGYHVQAPALRPALEDAVRREVEATDCLEGFHVLHSCAGGTGSGLGSAAAEWLADAYPASLRVHSVVFPYHAGEVIVQNYNALLTLAHLQAPADAVVLLENEAASELLLRELQVKRPTLRQVNRELAGPLAAALTAGDEAGADGSLYGTVAHLCPRPAMKWLSLWSVPQTREASASFTRNSWPGLLRRLGLMVSQRKQLEMQVRPQAPRTNVVAAMQVSLHGDAAAILQATDLAPVAQLPGAAARTRVVRSEVPTGSIDRTCTAMTNCQYGNGVVGRVVAKAERMLQSRAYLHQYERFGMSADTFAESFNRVQQVAASYDDLGNF